MADITPTVENPDKNAIIEWEQLNSDDAALEGFWPGGMGYIEVTGTFDGASLQMQFGLSTGNTYDLDTTAAPDGAAFTAAGITRFDLPRGYLKPVATSGGGSQDLDIKVHPKLED